MLLVRLRADLTSGGRCCTAVLAAAILMPLCAAYSVAPGTPYLRGTRLGGGVYDAAPRASAATLVPPVAAPLHAGTCCPISGGPSPGLHDAC